MIPNKTSVTASIGILFVLFLVGCSSGHEKTTRYKSGGIKSQSSSTGGIDNITEYFEDGKKRSLTKNKDSLELSYDEWYEAGRKKIERRCSYREEMSNGQTLRLFESRVEKHWFYTDSLLYRRIGWYENGNRKDRCNRGKITCVCQFGRC